jgi:hypothetical protein
MLDHQTSTATQARTKGSSGATMRRRDDAAAQPCDEETAHAEGDEGQGQ